MFINLNPDIIRNLAYYLDLFSVLNLSQVDKQIYKYFDEIFYRYYAIYVFGEEFWIKARKRPIIKSRPLKG